MFRLPINSVLLVRGLNIWQTLRVMLIALTIEQACCPLHIKLPNFVRSSVFKSELSDESCNVLEGTGTEICVHCEKQAE